MKGRSEGRMFVEGMNGQENVGGRFKGSTRCTEGGRNRQRNVGREVLRIKGICGGREEGNE